MYIKSVDVNNKDVFLGKGWENWCRYSRVEGRWTRTKGLRPDHAIHRKIVEKIEGYASRK
jgi:hypothetical protein